MGAPSVILGLNGPYHELSACLVVDGAVQCFLEEERLTRRRHAKDARIDNGHEWPVGAAEACLHHAGLHWPDVDEVAYAFVPEDRLRNVGIDPDPVPGGWGPPEGERRFAADVRSVEGRVRAHAGPDARFAWTWMPHHLAHAASAYLPSPFEESAVLSLDGIGELVTTWMGAGRGDRLEPLWTLAYPHSLGLLWETVSQALGLGAYGATKVMGLAAHGDPARYRTLFRDLVRLDRPGVFHLPLERLRFRSTGPGWGEREVPEAVRRDGEPFVPAHADLAAALQERTQEAVLHLARRLREATGSPRLCLAGGVALNCAANGFLAREGPFEAIFAQPAANDAGTAMGVALAAYHARRPGSPRWCMTTAQLGPTLPADARAQALAGAGLPHFEVADAAEEAAERLARGEVVGWYEGRSEAGPRALGGRSLLADPRRAEIKDHLNLRVKHREPFRPFGPAVLAEEADRWFEIPPAARPMLPYMLAAVRVRPGLRDRIPAVVHADGTSRLQLVPPDGSGYRRLLERFFERTGVPMVLNTSLNVREPIVHRPEEALRLLREHPIDALLLDGRLVVRVDEADAGAAPPARERFEPADDAVGPRLALVFGNEFAGGECPYWRAGECLHCDIGAGEGAPAGVDGQRRRLGWFARHYARELPGVAHLVVYNSGSVLNPKEMSPGVLREIVTWGVGLPGIRMISLDTREAFVRRELLAPLRAALPARVELRAILGLESADDEVRLTLLRKRMPCEAVERALAELAAAGPGTGAWLNAVFQPPGRVGAAAVADFVGTVRWGLEAGRRAGVRVDFNVHPFYPSKRSRAAYPEHPRADAVRLAEAMDAAREEIAKAGSGAVLFVGHQVEGHDQEPEARFAEVRRRVGAEEAEGEETR